MKQQARHLLFFISLFIPVTQIYATEKDRVELPKKFFTIVTDNTTTPLSTDEGQGDNRLDALVNANRQKIEQPNFAGFETRKGHFVIEKTNEKMDSDSNKSWYKIVDIKLTDNKTGDAQLAVNMLGDIRLNYDPDKGYTLKHTNWDSEHGKVAMQYVMFWTGRVFFKASELDNMSTSAGRKTYIKQLIQGATGCANNDLSDLTASQKEKARQWEDFDFFTLGFPNLHEKYLLDDPLFPEEIKVAFPNEVNKLFKPKGFFRRTYNRFFGSNDTKQAMHMVADLFEKYHTPQAIFNKLWRKSDEIKKARSSRASSREWLISIMRYKYTVLLWIFGVFFGYISITKLGAALYNYLFRKFDPISQLPQNVIRQYTFESNFFVRFVDRHFPVSFALRFRRFVKRRGWWRPRPAIKLTHVIYPNQLTESYIKEYIEDIKYSIRANRALIAAGKKPTYVLRTLFLYGPPGIGKTLIARAIAAELHAEGYTDTIEANTPELVKRPEFIATFWQEIQKKNNPKKPAVIICNEFDIMIRNRFGDKTNEMTNIHVGGFLASLDEKGDTARIFIFTMNTMLNDKKQRATLDEAALSRGNELQVPPPTKSKLAQILLLHLLNIGNKVGIELTQIELIKQQVLLHPYLSIKGKNGRDMAAIANKIILKKHKSTVKTAAKGKIKAKIYLVLQDIMIALDEELAIEAQNQQKLADDAPLAASAA